MARSTRLSPRGSCQKGNTGRRAVGLELGEPTEVILGQVGVGVRHREECVAHASLDDELESNIRSDLAGQADALARWQATIYREPIDHQHAHPCIVSQPSAGLELPQGKLSTEVMQTPSIQRVNGIVCSYSPVEHHDDEQAVCTQRRSSVPINEGRRLRAYRHHHDHIERVRAACRQA